jgi:hypothetical protein
MSKGRSPRFTLQGHLIGIIAGIVLTGAVAIKSDGRSVARKQEEAKASEESTTRVRDSLPLPAALPPPQPPAPIAQGERMAAERHSVHM